MENLIKITLITALLIFFNNNVVAETENEWQLSAKLYKTVATDPESILQSGEGIQLSLHRKNLYFYLSKDTNQVRFAGQGGPDVNLWSAGIGTQRIVGEYLILSIDIGWYQAMFSEMREPQIYPTSGPFSEGLCRYLNKFLLPDYGYPAWDYYTLDYPHGSIRGKINLTFEYPITEKISFNMTAGYRYLKLMENVQGRHYLDHEGTINWATNYWTIRYDRDFSAYIIGGQFNYKF